MSGTNFGQTGEDGDTSGDWGSVDSLMGASLSFGTGSTFNVAKTPDTASANAIQSMAPITADNTASDGQWSGFWQGLIGSVVKTGAGVVAARNGLIQPASTTPIPTPPTPNPNRTLVLLAIAAGVVYLVARKG